jgi:NAD+ diphosphatase
MPQRLLVNLQLVGHRHASKGESKEVEMLGEAQFNPLEGLINRDAGARSDEGLLRQLLDDASVRFVLSHDSKVLARGLPDATRISLLPSSGLPPTGVIAYLGRLAVDHPDAPAGTQLVLVQPAYSEVGADGDIRDGQEHAWLNPRRTNQPLHELDSAIWMQALALMNWHSSHLYCGRCGGVTGISQAGWARWCATCSREVFPRNDPAIIVAVTDSQDRILLGSQAVWEPNRWSILAGFVEAGEDIEAAARREVFEESGVLLSSLNYVQSQPWPFPHSLMFGFEASAVDGAELIPDGDEIARLRWFTREELITERAELLLPGHASIARKLIERWLGHGLDEGVS